MIVAAIMENQMEQQMENVMETGLYSGLLRVFELLSIFQLQRSH